MGDGFAICSIAEMNAGGGVGKFEDTLATRAAGVTRVAFQAEIAISVMRVSPAATMAAIAPASAQVPAG